LKTPNKNEKNAKLANERTVVQAVKLWYTEHNYGPSYRDLSKNTGLSVGTVFAACQELRSLGILTFEDKVARTIKLKEDK
jgi:hypothetical protein